MTERLASSEGRRGTELVSRIVNRELDAVAERILANRGDLIVFAGDAVIAIWPYGNGSAAATAARSAAAAAMAVVRSSRGGAEDAPHSVAVRAAIGIGDLDAFEVGGVEDRWRVLVAGPAIEDAVRADRHSSLGRVVLSPAARGAAGSSCRGRDLDEGFLELSEVLEDPHSTDPEPRTARAPALPAGLGSAYIPQVAVDRVRAGHGAWLAEFRKLSVLFIRLDGDAGASRVSASRIQTAVVATQRLLSRYDGELYNTLADDKGTVLIAVFGLPNQSHEDDAARAAITAIDLQAELEGGEIATSIGLSSGVAYCGLYEAASRRQFMVIGSVMNMAARLMTRADGSLVCDRPTADRLGSRPDVEVHPAGTVVVKGNSEPVEFFHPARSSRPAPHHSGAEAAPMVGRERELGQLTRLAERVGVDRARALALVEGESGSGKSLLAGRVLEAARNRGLPSFVGRVSDLERHTPYFPWRSVLVSLLGLGPSAADLSARLEQLGLSDELVRAAPLLGSVLGVDVDDNEWTAALGPESRAEVTRRLVVSVVDRGIRPAGVLWMDDAHLMDSASRAVLLDVLRGDAGLLAILTQQPTQPFPTEDVPPDVEVQRIHLGGLDLDAQRSVIAAALRCEGVDGNVVDWIAEQTGGNPLFSQQLALGLLETGQVELIGPQARFSDLTEFNLDSDHPTPLSSAPSLESAITSRVDALDVDAQLALKVLSVIGHAIDQEAVAEVHPTHPPPEALSDLLGELERRGMVHVERDLAAPRVSVAHSLIRRAVYDAVPFSLKKVLHEKVARWLESTEAPQVRTDHSTLAHHWLGADEGEKALPHLAGAGLDALIVHANLEAVRFFSKALELADALGPHLDRNDRARIGGWRVGRGRAYSNLQHYPDAVRELTSGLQALGERVPSSPAGLSFAGAAALGIHMVRRLGPRRKVPPGARREELLRLSRAYESLMEASYVSGDQARTFLAALRAVNRAEAAGPSPELARGYATLASMMGFVPLHRAARAYGTKALATARAVGDPSGLTWVQLALGVYHEGRGEWGPAVELLEEASELALQSGNRRRWMDCQAHLAQVSILVGRPARARERVDRALDRLRAQTRSGAPRAADMPKGTGQLLRVRGHALLALGETERAAAEFGLLRAYLARYGVEDDSTKAFQAVNTLAVERARRWSGSDDTAGSNPASPVDLPFAPAVDWVVEYEAIADALLDPSAVPPPNRGPAKGSVDAALVKNAARHARVFAVSRPVAQILEARLSRAGVEARLDRLRRAAELARGMGRPIVEGSAWLHLG
ncbi:MAG: AAA family ATPase, partial [Gemmatimonadetes bacterium]|nr:AAA family ATPase [Gemmatimonadota bacterium]